MIDDGLSVVGLAVGDGKSERCLTLVELELDTCWDRHPCSSPADRGENQSMDNQPKYNKGDLT